MSGDYQAPEGKIWVCTACGKTSANRMDGPRWWDESCFLNAALYPLELLEINTHGIVTAIKEQQS